MIETDEVITVEIENENIKDEEMDALIKESESIDENIKDEEMDALIKESESIVEIDENLNDEMDALIKESESIDENIKDAEMDVLIKEGEIINGEPDVDMEEIINEESELIECDTKLPHILADLLRITILVYCYGNKLVSKDNEICIKDFVSNMKNNGDFDKLEISDAPKNMLVEMAECVPTGKIHKFIVDPDTDIQACITTCEGKKRICIVFRGSESLSDLYYDLMITKYNITDDIRVHKGFYLQLTGNNVYKELVKNIQDILKIHPDYEINVTGHSLGGALSTLFGYMLAQIIKNHVTIVSFASPRVGNYKWKESFENTTNLTHYRVTNKRDIVTALPLYKYYHVGKNVQLSDDTHMLFENDNNKKWYEETLLTCWSVCEHSCELYYKRIQNNKIL